jgi:TolB protein
MHELQVRRLALVASVAAAILGAAGPALAQDRIVVSSETKAKKGLYPIAVPTAVDGDLATAKMVTEVQSFDLGVSSWFKVLDPKGFLADLKAEDMSIDPARWKSVGAFGVVKAKAISGGGKITLKFKLYEIEKGAVAVLEREYSGSPDQVRQLTHKWCNEVVKHFTGEPGFFGSQIAFSGGNRTGSKIYVVDFDGHGNHGITNNGSINILPSFSRDGKSVAFTSYMRGNPDLYVTTPGGGGRPKRIAKYGGMNTGASFSPDGSKVAVTLSRDGNPEIYILSASDGAIVKRLTDNRYIDTSPAWSPDGSEIAFVSNREGNPHIFVMGVDGSNARRVSPEGTYNQSPSWNPKKGMRQLAYTTRDDRSSNYDILTLDLASKKLARVTQNEGRNEDPAWSPNGRVLVFASTRSAGSGLYIANADGTGTATMIYKGTASSPDWGPAP